MEIYSNKSSDAKTNAQRNLMGRTHYVDPETLRYHHSRVLSARHLAQGLLFGIVESVAIDPRNTKRGCRFVIFDIDGNVIGERKSLNDCYSRSAQAEKAMYAALDGLDAIEITRAAIDRKEKHARAEIERDRATLADFERKASW